MEPVAEGITPGFARDISPLFTARDITAMTWAFDLTDYESVRSHAQAILEQVRAGRMPCYGPWPPLQVQLFERWLNSGMHP